MLNNNKNCHPREKGFSLIEVMIASLILLIGVTGFATLQTQMTGSNKSLELRTEAIQLAKQKMQELRYFDTLRPNNDQPNYLSIADDSGGASKAGEIEIIENAKTNSTNSFEQHWQVLDQYYVDVNKDGNADSWVTKDHENAPETLPNKADRKVVTVNVSWSDIDNIIKSYELTSYISPIPQNRSIHAFTQTPDSSLVPQIISTALHSNGVTSHPISSQISQSTTAIEYNDKSKVHTLSTLIFAENEVLKNITLHQRNEYAFSQCECTIAGNSQAKTPAQIVIKNNQLVTEKGSWINKTTGSALPGQSPLCDSCCRDHHDTQEMLEDQRYYKKELNSPHSHYRRINDNLYLNAISEGDHYDEVCRFQRIDGIFELLPDIQSMKTIMVAHNLVHQDNPKQYQQYVSKIVKHTILGLPLPESPFQNEAVMWPSAKQLVLQSIYVERLTESDHEKVTQMILNDEEGWQTVIPFLDVNLTLQAKWNSSDNSVANISNELADNTFSPKTMKYGSFSRGRLSALKAGYSHISSQITQSNEGLIGLMPISPFNQQQIINSNSLQIHVQSLLQELDVNTQKVGLIIDLYCISAVSEIEQMCTEEQLDELVKLKIAPENNEFDCNVAIITTTNTDFISCAGVPKGWQGNLIITPDLMKQNVTSYWKNPNNLIQSSPFITITEPLDKTSNSEYWLIVKFHN